MVHLEFVEELPNVSQWLYSGAVETPVPVSSLVHKARLSQNGEVLRDRGTADIEM